MMAPSPALQQVARPSKARCRRSPAPSTWLNSPPLTPGGLARQGRAGRLLDLLLHQLPAHDPLRPRLGREVQGPGPGRHRRARARVRVREAASTTCKQGGRGSQDRLPRGDRQRLRDLARLRQPVLAGALLHRRARAASATTISARAATTSPSASSSSCWPRPAAATVPADLVDVTAHGRAGRRRHGQRAVARDLCRLRPRRELRLARRRRRGRSARLRCRRRPRLNEWGLVGRLDDRRASRPRSTRADGSIVYRFHARDLHLVLGPSADGKPVRFRVTIDGARARRRATAPTSDAQRRGRRDGAAPLPARAPERARSPTARSRSSSSIPACRHMRSHSADCPSAPRA